MFVLLGNSGFLGSLHAWTFAEIWHGIRKEWVLCAGATVLLFTVYCAGYKMGSRKVVQRGAALTQALTPRIFDIYRAYCWRWARINGIDERLVEQFCGKREQRFNAYMEERFSRPGFAPGTQNEDCFVTMHFDYECFQNTGKFLE